MTESREEKGRPNPPITLAAASMPITEIPATTEIQEANTRRLGLRP